MKLSDQLCTLEQAKKLKDLGIEQYSYWYIVFTSSDSVFSLSAGIYPRHTVLDILINNQPGMRNNSDMASVFTVAELGELLPEFIYKIGETYRLKSWRYNDSQGTWHSIAYEEKDNETKRIPEFNSPIQVKTEAISRAALLIYLLENNLTTPQEVNDRILKS